MIRLIALSLPVGEAREYFPFIQVWGGSGERERDMGRKREEDPDLHDCIAYRKKTYLLPL
jgi:hypothetical protein